METCEWHCNCVVLNWRINISIWFRKFRSHASKEADALTFDENLYFCHLFAADALVLLKDGWIDNYSIVLMRFLIHVNKYKMRTCTSVYMFNRRFLLSTPTRLYKVCVSLNQYTLYKDVLTLVHLHGMFFSVCCQLVGGKLINRHIRRLYQNYNVSDANTHLADPKYTCVLVNEFSRRPFLLSTVTTHTTHIDTWYFKW